MEEKDMPYIIRNLYYYLRFAQEAILILRYIYTHPRVLEELESANEEIHSAHHHYNQGTENSSPPKIIDPFAKISGLEASDLKEMVKPYLPDSHRKSIQEFQSKTSWKGIELVPHKS